ncbi:hypothetical protein [Nitratiruptor sp. YY09-18]|uniref:hypothetical protein n=1 Tax=Nitratiruptor sp. YY09-18 TaxID=2724901 RepID=UPI0019158EB8|nr:hypothetical protein [Nitratiruptor sp. YY09-18]BCD68896.1 hypothetical protein NitYY0918_C1815 [Nitratiruptor sp. YY09-18]
MRSVLGSLFIIIAACAHTLHVSTTTPSIKEPVIIEFAYEDREFQKITWVKFKPLASPAYETHFLKKDSKEGVYRFYYLLFPLKPGEVQVRYSLRVKKASVEEIHKDILGTGYEQTNPIEGKVYDIAINPTLLHVKDVKANLFGKFIIERSIDPKAVKAYEPVYVNFIIKGKGYPPKFAKLVDIEGVKILTDKPQEKIVYKLDGAHVNYRYSYAIIANHPFTINSLHLKGYDYKSFYTINLPTQKIVVTPPKNLVDKETYPKPIEPFYKKVVAALGYIAIFIAGFLSAWIIMRYFRDSQKEEIKNAKDAKELLAILVVKYPECFEDEKRALQSGESVAKIKKRVLKGLKQCR